MAEKKEKNWYISLMAPNQKGAGFAWLDPTRLYANAQALQDCIADLLEPFDASEIDLVAGIDSVGFILGTGIAIKLNKPMLAIRKKGGLCVKTFGEKYVDYQKTPKELEIRQDAFPEGTKVLIVDQWIETGGTMQAAVNLVERLKGKVAGMAAIAIESNKHEKAKELTMKYKCSHVIPSHLQSQIDNQYLESFKVFEDGKAGYAYNP
ncbi:adenine phosphoribosyltransferase-like isoform X2 [Ptychodera flava]